MRKQRTYFILDGAPSNRQINQGLQSSIETVGWNTARTKCMIKVEGEIPDSFLDLRAYSKKEILVELGKAEWDWGQGEIL